MIEYMVSKSLVLQGRIMAPPIAQGCDF
jgi:hypothetical protein